jgi:superfamily II DNA or RNA helicase
MLLKKYIRYKKLNHNGKSRHVKKRPQKINKIHKNDGSVSPKTKSRSNNLIKTIKKIIKENGGLGIVTKKIIKNALTKQNIEYDKDLFNGMIDDIIVNYSSPSPKHVSPPSSPSKRKAPNTKPKVKKSLETIIKELLYTKYIQGIYEDDWIPEIPELDMIKDEDLLSKYSKKMIEQNYSKIVDKFNKFKTKCKDNQYLNIITMKCVSLPTYYRHKKTVEELEPCKKNQIRDPITRRCINLNNDNIHIKTAEDVPIEGDCVERSDIKLRDLQKRVIEYMNYNDSLLVVHDVGLGKTLTSIGVSECFLDENENHRTIIVCPASLVTNYKKEMIKYGVKRAHAVNYTFYSFEKFLNFSRSNKPVFCDKNTLLILDEIHNLRNTKSHRYDAVLNCVLKAKKRLLLTATPFVNRISDYVILINLLYGKILVQEKFDNAIFDTIDRFNDHNIYKVCKFLEYRIDIKDNNDRTHFPTSQEQFIHVDMSKTYYMRYVKLMMNQEIDELSFSNPHKFYNGYRRAVNYAGGKEYITNKLSRAVPIMKSGKTFIFTNWLQFGTSVITKILKKEGLTFRLITGKINMSDRTRIIEEFNDDKFNVLIITRAGGEGISLKGVQNVVVLDPTWNYASIYQVIGRAIRYNSHVHLPEEMRHVNIYLMIARPPSTKIDKNNLNKKIENDDEDDDEEPVKKKINVDEEDDEEPVKKKINVDEDDEEELVIKKKFVVDEDDDEDGEKSSTYEDESQNVENDDEQEEHDDETESIYFDIFKESGDILLYNIMKDKKDKNEVIKQKLKEYSIDNMEKIQKVEINEFVNNVSNQINQYLYELRDKLDDEFISNEKNPLKIITEIFDFSETIKLPKFNKTCNNILKLLNNSNRIAKFNKLRAIVEKFLTNYNDKEDEDDKPIIKNIIYDDDEEDVELIPKKIIYEDEDENIKPIIKKIIYDDDEENDKPNPQKIIYDDDEENVKSNPKKIIYDDDEDDEENIKSNPKKIIYDDDE